jgi:hypothetical protein
VRALAIVMTMMLVSGCGTTAGRLRLISSQATQASWSLVVDDRARGAELLIDGRLRDDACERVRSTIRCELRGLWPGGHTLEMHLPGAVLKRTVLIGKPWPERLVFARAASRDEARAAAEAGADVIIAEGDVDDAITGAHQAGARAAVAKDVTLIERGGADAVLDADLPADVAQRFPEARRLAAPPRAASLAEAAAAIAQGQPIEVAPNAFALLRARKKHAALQRGDVKTLVSEAGHRAWELHATSDSVIVAINDSDGEWTLKTDFRAPIDLLGGHANEDQITVRARDVGVIIRSPLPDVTRY